MAFSYLLAVPVLGVCIYCIFTRMTASKPSLLPLPPGPATWPIIGNLHQLPNSHVWLQYHKWAKEFGPVIHLDMAGRSIVLLNTVHAAHDVLAKQGAIFSDRPEFVVASELSKRRMHILLMPYDARFKLYHKLQAPLLSERVAGAYVPLQELESKQLLWDLLETASESGIDCHGYVQRAAGSIIFTLLYGQRLLSPQDPRLCDSRDIVRAFAQIIRPGASLVDLFPALSNLPAPLATWKTAVENHWIRESHIHMANLEAALESPRWNLAKQMQRAAESQKVDMSMVELGFAIGTLLIAALDGPTESFMWFLVACAAQGLDKSWLLRAQRDLDVVVGHDRLPSLDDRPQLPYIDAIIKEIMRWRPIGPLSVPHYNKVEATYQGYRIPKDSIVVSNIYSIGLDESLFGSKHKVEDFVPDRWLHLGEEEKLPVVGFGYGRRECPGKFVADNSLWTLVARVLWAFDIKPGLSESGNPWIIDPDRGNDGLTFRPLNFKVSFKPRGPWARDVITRDGNPQNVDLGQLLEQIEGSRRRKE